MYTRLRARATNASRDFIGVIGRNACGSLRRVIPPRPPDHRIVVVSIMKRRLITAAETAYDYVENGLLRWRTARVYFDRDETFYEHYLCAG